MVRGTAGHLNLGNARSIISISGGKPVKALVTVLGKDKVGIIAKVCTYLADRNANVLEISQTIIKGYFDMLMIIDIQGISCTPGELAGGLKELGMELGLMIKFQREEIFESMHRI